MDPHFAKDFLALALFFLSAYLLGNPLLFALCDPCGCPHPLGYPLHFVEEGAVGASFTRDIFSCGTATFDFSFPNLVLDLVFWYFLVYLADCAIKRLGKKKK